MIVGHGGATSNALIHGTIMCNPSAPLSFSLTLICLQLLGVLRRLLQSAPLLDQRRSQEAAVPR